MFGQFSPLVTMEEEAETLTLAQPSIVSLSKPLFFVRKKSSEGEELESTSVIEIVSSSSEDVSCNRKTLFRMMKDTPYQEEMPLRVQSNLIVDWESELVNSFSQEEQKKKERAICGFAVQMWSSPQTPKYEQIMPCLIDWNFESLSTESFQIFNNTESNYRCIGFIDGRLVKIKNQNWGSNAEIYLEEKDVMLAGMEKVELPGWNSRSALIIPLPCDNVEERKYSLNALVGTGSTIYLFNLKEKLFEKFTLKDMSFLSGFEIKSEIFYQVIIKEGKRLRVFVLLESTLYELRWENGQVIVVDHLVWLRQEISNILRVGNSLLVFTSKGEFIYTPSTFDMEAKKGTLASVKMPKNVAQILIWDDKSKCLIDGIGLLNGKLNSIILTGEEISKLDYKPLSECYSEEEIFQQYLFKTYVPPKITDAFQITKREQGDTSFRGEVYYDCKKDRYNDMEIIAGIRCRDNEKLKFAISPQYVELNPQDLADYLGAPIMISAFDSFNLASIHDMMGKRRDASQIMIKTGVFRSNFDLKGNNFLGILSPKDDNSTQQVVKHVGNEEWKDLATRKQFRVESNEIRVADFTTHGYVEIVDVESGIWSYNQKLENDLPAQLIAYNQNYRDTVNPDIEQDWNVPDETFSESLHNSYSVSELTTKTRPLSNDWQVSSCGCCVDGGIIGIFDATHYKDDKVFSSEARGFDIPFPSRENNWFNRLHKMLTEQGFPTLACVPYGVVSRDAETGDGHYACLSKVFNGKVVAVKVIIQHPAYP